ncbi:hypothetical protein DBR32_04990 [Taibaiella sp. KBW10]|nr:hypothetical protein DBR32_04990 [Taibaiella sp. KBW10]
MKRHDTSLKPIAAILLWVLIFLTIVSFIACFQIYYVLNSPILPQAVVWDVVLPFLIKGTMLMLLSIVAAYFLLRRRYQNVLILSGISLQIHFISELFLTTAG